ncbi:hypothetical protein H0H92_015854, partial [Tricholoma furcatifolium]
MKECTAFVNPHGLIDGSVFSIVKSRAQAFPPIPSPIDYPPGRPVLPYLNTVLWASNQNPFLPLIPKYNAFDGPLFSRLALMAPCSIETSTEGNYTLEPSLKTEIIALERNLRTVLYAIYDLVGPITK